jgi:hypothetical protein
MIGEESPDSVSGTNESWMGVISWRKGQQKDIPPNMALPAF